jgi:hypothetical protein
MSERTLVRLTMHSALVGVKMPRDMVMGTGKLPFFGFFKS